MMNQQLNISQQTQSDDLLTILKALALVWKHKKWIALITFLATVLGVVYALLATPVYTSEAIIAPKETDKSGGAAGLLSQMGEMGGLVATQIGISAGTTYERIAIIAKSHDLAEDVILRHNLLPLLFHKMYDSKNGCWKISGDSTKVPDVRQGIKALTGGVLAVSTDMKKQIIRLKVNFYDPVLAEKIAEYYVNELDNKIKGDVIAEARVKRAYLEAQMKSTADPWVVQKLQTLVVMEMEKSMMVAGRSIVVLETPMVPLKRTAPKRRNIVAVAFFLGLFFSAGFFLSLDKIKEMREKYRGKV
jgi:capsular polysaccharide biosynthesis protein